MLFEENLQKYLGSDVQKIFEKKLTFNITGSSPAKPVLTKSAYIISTEKVTFVILYSH